MLAGSRRPKSIAVFISGGGSTLQALLEVQHQFSIRIVITTKKNVLGSLKAKRFGIPVIHFKKTESFTALTKLLKSKKVDLIFLAGFMRLLPEDFVNHWQGQIFNIHPSLLPEFPGLNSAEKSYLAKKQMGVTIHYVTAEMDQGKRFLQIQAIEKKLSKSIAFKQTMYFLRRSEQFLLRDFAIRKGL